MFTRAVAIAPATKSRLITPCHGRLLLDPFLLLNGSSYYGCTAAAFGMSSLGMPLRY
jgi:hypothetical protein